MSVVKDRNSNPLLLQYILKLLLISWLSVLDPDGQGHEKTKQREHSDAILNPQSQAKRSRRKPDRHSGMHTQ